MRSFPSGSDRGAILTAEVRRTSQAEMDLADILGIDGDVVQILRILHGRRDLRSIMQAESEE